MMRLIEPLADRLRAARMAAIALALPAIAGCATDPWSMRDYAAAIEQARKVGVVTWSPAAERSAQPRPCGDSANVPCMADDRQTGSCARTAHADGNLPYSFPEDCAPVAPPGR
jgi:hypothetical protein